MFKTLIGGAIGATLAKKSPKIGTAKGAVFGSITPFVLSRLSLPAIIAVSAGGYMLKRYRDRQAVEEQATGQQPAAQQSGDPVAKPVQSSAAKL